MFLLPRRKNLFKKSWLCSLSNKTFFKFIYTYVKETSKFCWVFGIHSKVSGCFGCSTLNSWNLFSLVEQAHTMKRFWAFYETNQLTYTFIQCRNICRAGGKYTFVYSSCENVKQFDFDGLFFFQHRTGTPDHIMIFSINESEYFVWNYHFCPY